MFTKSLLSISMIIGSVVLVGCMSPKSTTPTGNNTVRNQPSVEVQEPMVEKPSLVDIVVNTEDVSTLRDIVLALDMVDTLNSEGPFTVFAPTNAAFDELLSELGLSFNELAENEALLRTIVEYHVLPATVPSSDVLALESESKVPTLGGEEVTIFNTDGVQINESNVIALDIMASNGIIHLIDAVLLPPSVVETLNGVEELEDTIVTTAISSGSFPTLVAAVQAAGLVDTLNSEGPFTVFAPNEEAFAALLAQLDVTSEELLADTDLLTSVLTYHVLPGIYTAEDVVGLEGSTAFTTVQGSSVTIDPNGGSPKINDSMIIATDIMTSNGVIHVIDAVLIPSS